MMNQLRGETAEAVDENDTADTPGHDVARDAGSLRRQIAPAEADESDGAHSDAACSISQGTRSKARRTMDQVSLRPPGPAPGTRACLVPMRAARDNLQLLYESGSASFYDIILRVGKSLRLPHRFHHPAAPRRSSRRMLGVQMIEQHAGEIQLECQRGQQRDR